MQQINYDEKPSSSAHRLSGYKITNIGHLVAKMSFAACVSMFSTISLAQNLFYSKKRPQNQILLLLAFYEEHFPFITPLVHKKTQDKSHWKCHVQFCVTIRTKQTTLQFHISSNKRMFHSIQPIVPSTTNLMVLSLHCLLSFYKDI